MGLDLLAVFLGSFAAFMGGLVAASLFEKKDRSDEHLIVLAAAALKAAEDRPDP